MKALTTLSLLGTVLLFGVGSASAATIASFFEVNRQALEHNCADARAMSGNDFEIITQCGR